MSFSYPGKKVGYNLYIHRSLVWQLPEELCEKILKLDDLFFKNKWGEAYDVIKIELRKNDISFIRSDSFNTIHEPFVDMAYVIRNENLYKTIDFSKRHINYRPIYHHKWMMVDRAYPEFNVNREMEYSSWWENHSLTKVAKAEDPYFKSHIGLYGYWSKFIHKLNENEMGVFVGFGSPYYVKS